MIKILPSDIVNQIAAGEVVERPASIVKELVENAIDAGGTKIAVSVKDGGKSYICVRDNGSGMTAKDLDLCILRHATSKLTGHNLLDVNSFGFRGEALPSICSISRVEIKTKHMDEQIGWALSIDGGNVIKKEPVAQECGTAICVRDLFFNTPVRLKFLKSTSSELMACAQQVKQLALSNPDVEFSFINGDKLLFSYVATANDWMVRVRDVFGEDFGQSSLLVEKQWNDMNCFGLISYPTYRQNDGQYIFVNKRFIKDRLLSAAVKVSYHDVIFPGENPSYALFIFMNTQNVDANVHPSKTEVRFRQPGNVRSLLISAIQSALSTAQKTSASLSGKIMSYVLAENSGLHENKLTLHHQYEDNVFNLDVVNDVSAINGASIINFNTIADNNYSAQNTSLKSADDLYYNNDYFPKQLSSDIYLGEAKVQIFDSFIISQNDESIFLVDQHAAHERIVYEQLRKDLSLSENGTIVWRGVCQKLMFPIKITLAEDNKLIVSDILPYLKEIGFSCNHNENEIAIDVLAIPKICESLDIVDLVMDLIAEQRGIVEQSTLLVNIHRIFATYACHNSVRANHPLCLVEMNALLRQIESTQRSGQCNHGRPVYVQLSRKNIETLFERTG
jgi:DNA mismatch repair protein MutL